MGSKRATQTCATGKSSDLKMESKETVGDVRRQLPLGRKEDVSKMNSLRGRREVKC